MNIKWSRIRTLKLFTQWRVSKVCNLAFAIGNHRQATQESLGRRIIQNIRVARRHMQTRK